MAKNSTKQWIGWSLVGVGILAASYAMGWLDTLIDSIKPKPKAK